VPKSSPKYALAAMLLVLLPSGMVTQAAHPVVAGFERFFTSGTADAARGGQLLLSELNCTSCHKPEGALGVAAPKTAPILTGITGRVKANFLRKFLADPHGTKPGTTMPSLLGGSMPAEKSAQASAAEALVHYLASLGPREPEQEFPTTGAHVRGEDLFHRVGCAACHGSRGAGAPPLATSVPLPDCLEKYTLPSLTRFLLDPLHVRPAGRMPNLNLSGSEARDIASYLLKGLPEVAQVQYSYYEGSWNSLPDFSKLTAKTTGHTTRIDETLKQRGDQFALRFEGFLRIDREGDYTFHLTSDDGSRLLVDDKLVVNNDNVHATTHKGGKARLAAGLHAVVVEYFEQGGEERLIAEYEGPGVRRQKLADAMSVAKQPPPKEQLAIDVKPALVEHGRKLFATLGCASCHEVKEQGKVVTSQLAAPMLTKLRKNQGCLAAVPEKKLPQYQLSPRQRTSLAAALEALKNRPPAAATPQQAIAHTLTTFNCCACHQRDKVGGVEPERDAVFQTTMKEMGDEGRLPPSLDGVGAKLTPQWLERIFAQGADDRPYMYTRMPRFGLANVGHLVPLLRQVDKIEPVAPVKSDAPLIHFKSAGWQMVGNKGFGCVKCHRFGPFAAEGIQAMDLAVMRQRLNEDWFKRYMRNPQVFRPGTRMPSAWPNTGKSLLKDILEGDIDKQIHAVWSYLADGAQARTPYGMVTGGMMLTPFNEAIIYRNFIEGAGPRAIGVGFPENRHLAFDANNLRLALIWQGSYIDAKRHWSGRGEGFQPPAGSAVIRLPDGVSFARMPNPDAPWPKQSARELGYHFRGYRLSKDQRPTFLYDIGPVQVEDVPNPLSTTTSITLGRTLTLKSSEPISDLWFRAAAGSKIVAGEGGWYEVDGGYRVRFKAGGPKPILRKQENTYDLLLRVTFSQRHAAITQEYEW
jgi:mono/diheme cytochrome c family protein